MAHQRTQTVMALFLMAIVWGGVKAQDCTNVIISMSPCLNYIQGNSTTPSSACCTQLASVVRSQPQCLCQVLNGGASSLGLNINQTQALELPKDCNVQTPSVSQCKAGSPADSPSGTPGTSGSVPSGTGRGSNSVPSTENGGGSSNATTAKLAAPVLFFLLFITSYAF
ncbi:hypothetical protein M9H77_35194 [Catharanthus roseus]|uniref:Uncharacterized protein n=1 Tax=Catharanthus roseus TaxID=4058 RepID=A0ACB9ZNB7_CATRO|nr:hypothetical protein M9H77_35194 [Catharanthus roseus]